MNQDLDIGFLTKEVLQFFDLNKEPLQADLVFKQIYDTLWQEDDHAFSGVDKKDKHKLKELFQIKVQNITKCEKNDSHYNSLVDCSDAFYTGPRTIDIQTLLDSKFETINGSENCKKCVTEQVILDAPEILVVRLDLFNIDNSRIRGSPNIPETLYLSKTHQWIKKLHYELVGKVVFEGNSLNTGKYIAVVNKKQRGWVKFSVDTIEDYDFPDREHAELLFYLRKEQ